MIYQTCAVLPLRCLQKSVKSDQRIARAGENHVLSFEINLRDGSQEGQALLEV